MTKVLGFDIGKDFCVACILEAKPEQPRKAYRDLDFITVTPSAQGIAQLLELKPDIAVMEPTGTNYQKLWGEKFKQAGIQTCLIGNDKLAHYRKTLNFSDKSDSIDAFALACYYFDSKNSQDKFIETPDATIARIREISHRLDHYSRLRTPIINRIRQDLAWQFPEYQNKKSDRATLADPPTFWRWLAGETKYKRYDSDYQQTIGIGLQQELQFAAKQVCQLMKQEQQLEQELQNFLQAPKFTPYQTTFARFGMGLRLSGLFLGQIYPLEKLLGPNGKPEIKIYPGKISGKPTKHHLSLRKFKKTLGVAPSTEQSGTSTNGTKKSGNSLCRRALWQLVFCRYEVRKNRPKNEIGEAIGKLVDELKANQCPIRKLRSKVSAKLAEAIFKELVQQLGSN